MSKKILAGVLAAASILSVSATAFAASTDPNDQPIASGNGATYTVSAGITEGTVNVTLPAKNAIEKGVFLNPYGVAVKSDGDGDSTFEKNTAGVASNVFEISNNDTEDAVKVMATVAVAKATGVVVKDANATASTAYLKGETVADASLPDTLKASKFDVTVDLDTVKVTKDKDSGAVTVEGGAKAAAAKQKKNVALWLSGVGDTGSDDDVISKTKITANDVAFLAKGTNSGTLIPSIAASGKGYFAVNGKVNPEYKGEWDVAKDNLSLTIILKCMPTA